MGLDVGHMSYAGMAKALPPAYISYVFGQMAMHVARERYGVPSITFDEMLDCCSTVRDLLSSIKIFHKNSIIIHLF